MSYGPKCLGDNAHRSMMQKDTLTVVVDAMIAHAGTASSCFTHRPKDNAILVHIVNAALLKAFGDDAPVMFFGKLYNETAHSEVCNRAETRAALLADLPALCKMPRIAKQSVIRDAMKTKTADLLYKAMSAVTHTGINFGDHFCNRMCTDGQYRSPAADAFGDSITRPSRGVYVFNLPEVKKAIPAAVKAHDKAQKEHSIELTGAKKERAAQRALQQQAEQKAKLAEATKKVTGKNKAK